MYHRAFPFCSLLNVRFKNYCLCNICMIKVYTNVFMIVSNFICNCLIFFLYVTWYMKMYKICNFKLFFDELQRGIDNFLWLMWFLYLIYYRYTFRVLKEKTSFLIYIKKNKYMVKFSWLCCAVKKIHLMTELFPLFYFFFLSNSKKSISKLRIYFWDIFYTNNLHTGNQVTGYNLQKIFLFSFFCVWVGGC